MVTAIVAMVDGITDSETMPAFRTHTKHDLESMVYIGADE